MRTISSTIAIGICALILSCSTSNDSEFIPPASSTGSTGSTAGSGGGNASGATSTGTGTSGSVGSSTATTTTSASGTTGVGGSGGAGTTSAGSAGTGGAGGSGGSGGAGGTLPSSKDAGTDASTVKEGGSDAPTATGGPGCTGVVAKFCDDFEKQTAATPSGDFSVTGSGITVDSTKASSGTKSLHWKPTGTSAQLVFTKQFPFNDLHGRMMMFMTKTPTTSSHWDIIQSNNGGNTQWEVGGQFGNFELVCDPPDNGLDSKTKFPDSKWVCVQWEFKFTAAGADTSFLTQVDGVPVDQGMFTGANSKGEKWVAGPWKDLHIGWEIFGGTTAVEFWIDDLAFGDQEIPCPTP